MIGVTIGDPSGVGPEITLKAAASLADIRLRIIGNRQILERIRERLGFKLDLAALVRDTGEDFRFAFGRPQKKCGAAALAYIEQGLSMIRHREARALVTAPICKEAFWQAGVKFPGHTELLAARARVRDFCMAAVGPDFCIAFVTTHQSLESVSRSLNPAIIFSRIRLLNGYLRRFRRTGAPRIAVLAFNPHGDEFSRGEEEKVAQAVRRAGRNRINVRGPFPADSLGQLFRDYDGIVAMYHDQGMIPAKLLSRGQGVNVTLGLPFVRTSPLHGVAFDIAGKGIASSSSMEAAIRLAHQLTQRTGESEKRRDGAT